MSVRPATIGICAVSMLLLSLALFDRFFEEKIEKKAGPNPQAPQPGEHRKRPVATLPADFDWDSAKDEELKSILDALDSLDEPGDQEGFEIEAVVEPGTQIVADSFEGENGEFVFTTLVPVFEDWPGQGEGVTVRVDCFSVSLDGATQKVFRSDETHPAYEIRIPPNGITTHFATSDYGRYVLNLVPTIEKGGLIRLRASARYDETATGMAEMGR